VRVNGCPSTIAVAPLGFQECLIKTTTPSPGISCGASCSNNCAGGPLTMMGDTVYFAINRTIVLESTCSLAITETEGGTFTGSMIAGSASLDVTAVGDCGPEFPCQVEGNFVLVLQPPPPPSASLRPDCLFPWCGPPL